MNASTVEVAVEIVPTFCGKTIREIQRNVSGLPAEDRNRFEATKVGISTLAKNAGLMGRAALTLAFYETLKEMSHDMAEEVAGE